MHDDLNDEKEPGSDEGDPGVAATWGSVDANGNRIIRGVMLKTGSMYYPNMDRTDLQGDQFSEDALRNMQRQIHAEENVTRYTREFFDRGAMPPGMTRLPITYRKPKNLTKRRAALLLCLWAAIILIVVFILLPPMGVQR